MSGYKDEQLDGHRRIIEPRPAIATAQVAQGSYDSRSLSRTQHYEYFMPAAVETSQRLPLLVLLHGAAGCSLDWDRHTRLRRYVAAAPIIVVCPDGDDAWYTNAANGGECREDDIVQDLLPHLEATLPLMPYPHRGIGGFSMGGYGAVKIALKYPGLFRTAVAHSGAFDGPARPDLDRVFGHAERNIPFRKEQSVYWLAETALCRPPADRPALLLDCGLSDPLLTENRRFSDHLNYIGFTHDYREWRGHHSWPYWDRAFRTRLPELLNLVNPRPCAV